MKIVLDVSALPYGTGVSLYVKELVQALARNPTPNEYVLFAGAWGQQVFFKDWFERAQLGTQFSLKVVPLPPRAQAILWNDIHIVNVEWIIGKFDVFHSLDWSMPPTKYKEILTVHDIFFLKYPDLQQHPFADTLRRRLERARSRNAPLIAVSKTTKQDIIESLDYPEELITLIYEAGRTHTQELKLPDMQQVKRRLGIRTDYLLMTSTREPRKNMDQTISAFSKLHTDMQLVIVGKRGWADEKTPMVRNVIFTGYLSDEELEGLRRGARGLLFPSLYEGFGLPILEAFASGIPVLTSNVSSMPEVAGKAAIYVDPHSPESLESGIQRLISLTHSEREALIAAGTKQLSKFSWDLAAQKTLALYQKVLA